MGNLILRQIQMSIPLEQTVEWYSAVSGISVKRYKRYTGISGITV